MKIRPELSFKECLILLNILAKYVDGYDFDGEEVVYIDVKKEISGNVLNIMYSNGDYADYLKEYCCDEDSNSIDITGLWGEIGDRFKKDIWYSVRKGFYVRRWYHVLHQKVTDKKRRIKYWFNSIKVHYDMAKRERQRQHQQKQLIKSLCKKKMTGFNDWNARV